MKFEVTIYGSEGFRADHRPVNWIKDFREQTGVGLREAKNVCDWVRNQLMTCQQTSFTLDTDLNQDFKFLEESATILAGFPTMIKVAGKTSGIDANQVLKNTAIRLIRMGAISQARAVLQVLL